jgi:hypothetical protein
LVPLAVQILEDSDVVRNAVRQTGDVKLLV